MLEKLLKGTIDIFIKAKEEIEKSETIKGIKHDTKKLIKQLPKVKVIIEKPEK